jgi:hypothetical protein
VTASRATRLGFRQRLREEGQDVLSAARSRVDDYSGGDGEWSGVPDLDVLAQELSIIGENLRDLERRMAEVERVNARLEDAALTTARALGEIARHWDAVYEAMRRAEKVRERAELTWRRPGGASSALLQLQSGARVELRDFQ